MSGPQTYLVYNCPIGFLQCNSDGLRYVLNIGAVGIELQCCIMFGSIIPDPIRCGVFIKRYLVTVETYAGDGNIHVTLNTLGKSCPCCAFIGGICNDQVLVTECKRNIARQTVLGLVVDEIT